MSKRIFLIVLVFMFSLSGNAKVSLNNIFDNNMVLQRDKPVRIWGWASPGEKVQVSFKSQHLQTEADEKGEWQVYLKPMPASTSPHSLTVTGEENQIVYSNILLGDVWILGGQSNMEFHLEKVYDGDLEILAAKNNNIRLMTIPYASSARKGLDNIERLSQFNPWDGTYEDKGSWSPCYSDKARQFSSLGYMFGKTLQQITEIPIGLIDASRGGTTMEGWLSPEMLASMPENAALLEMWEAQVKAYDPKKVLKQEIENWEKRSESRKKQGLQPGPKPTEPSPSPIESFQYPGASYNGFIHPIAGFAVKGVIFNHGYNNALGDSRPQLYAANFNAFITDWRKTFNDENLPFGIIELTAGGKAQTMDNYEAAMFDAAPYIREGQYMAYLKNKNVGYCCAYDQQVEWYHPYKKLPLGVRMARWALAEVYGYSDIVWEPAKVVKTEKTQDNAIVVTFDKEVKSTDDRPIEGFAIAASDGRFYPAKAVYPETGKNERGKIQYDKTKLIVSSNLVQHPVAVRYAWARNPLANLVSDRIIPVPQFRTDSWNYPEAPYLDWNSQGFAEFRAMVRGKLKQAEQFAQDRKLKEAGYLLKNAKTE